MVLKEGEDLPPEEVIDWCLERLANFKIPRYLVYMKSLPKTPSQRVAKYLLRGKSMEVGLDMKEYIQKVSRERKSLEDKGMRVFNKDPPE